MMTSKQELTSGSKSNLLFLFVILMVGFCKEAGWSRQQDNCFSACNLSVSSAWEISAQTIAPGKNFSLQTHLSRKLIEKMDHFNNEILFFNELKHDCLTELISFSIWYVQAFLFKHAWVVAIFKNLADS